MICFIAKEPRLADKELISAVLRNDIAAVRITLRAGADPNSRADWDGIKAIDRAKERCFDEVASLLERSGAAPEIPIKELRKGFKWKTPKFEDG